MTKNKIKKRNHCASDIGRIMETDLDEQLLANEQCTRCANLGSKYWVYNELGRGRSSSLTLPAHDARFRIGRIGSRALLAISLRGGARGTPKV